MSDAFPPRPSGLGMAHALRFGSDPFGADPFANDAAEGASVDPFAEENPAANDPEPATPAGSVEETP